MAIQTPPSTAAATALIHRLDELSRDDIPFAGGKGANLGELTKAGFPVPPGFVHPEYADLLVEAGIDAVSVNLDAVEHARRLLDAAEGRIPLEHVRAGGGS